MHFKRIKSVETARNTSIFRHASTTLYRLQRSDLTIDIEFERMSYRQTIHKRRFESQAERMQAIINERCYEKQCKKGLFSIIANGKTLYGARPTENVHLLMRMIEQNPHKFLREFHAARRLVAERKDRAAAMLETYLDLPTVPSAEQIYNDMITYDFGEPGRQESGSEVIHHCLKRSGRTGLEALIKRLRTYNG